MAEAPPRLAASPDGLPFFPDLALGRCLGADARPPPGDLRATCGSTRASSAGSIDSQTGKTTARGRRGSEGGKRSRGRQRPMVAVRGLLWVVRVPAAGLQDCEGVQQVLTALGARFPGRRRLWAGAPGAFGALQWRWSVERTCGWLNRLRRLSKACEALPETTEAWLRIAMIHRRVRRLAARG